jgi:hypothetical protein
MVLSIIDNLNVFGFNPYVLQTKSSEMKFIFLATVATVNTDKNWELIWTAFSAIVAVLALAWAILERLSKMRTDKKLEEIKRRGDAPFLRVCDSAMGNITFFKDGVVEYRHATTDKSMISFQHQRVEALNAGDAVFLLIDDTGEPTNHIAVKLDDAPIVFGIAFDDDARKTVSFIEYPFDPEKIGRQQRIVLSFESRSGVHNKHTYITRHGYRFLKRTNPALPE